MWDRQADMCETGSLGNIKPISFDTNAGMIMPCRPENKILFLAGERDGNILIRNMIHALSSRSANTKPCPVRLAFPSLTGPQRGGSRSRLDLHSAGLQRPACFIIVLGERPTPSNQMPIHPHHLWSPRSLRQSSSWQDRAAQAR